MISHVISHVTWCDDYVYGCVKLMFFFLKF